MAEQLVNCGRQETDDMGGRFEALQFGGIDPRAGKLGIVIGG